jgi:hypothetical protein
MSNLDYKGIEFLIEADGFSQSCLWQKFHTEIKWVQCHGWLETVGYVNDRPICISTSIIKLDDKKVLFWYPTSMLVDHNLINDWIDKIFGKNITRCNALNFHLCFDYIKGFK